MFEEFRLYELRSLLILVLLEPYVKTKASVTIHNNA